MEVKMKNLKFSLAIVFALSTFVACDNNDFEEPALYANCDVFVQVKKVGEETHYAPVLYTSANKSLFTVEVEDPSSPAKTYELSEYFAGKGIFRNIPKETDFSATDVTNGIYKFTVKTERNEILNIQDQLIESRIAPMVINDYTYNKENHNIELHWSPLENADVYIVKVLTEINGNSIFVSKKISETEFSFNRFTEGWLQNVELKAGKKYWIGVYGYDFKTSNADNNINSVSVEYKEIEW